jgi:hypothetical protein
MLCWENQFSTIQGRRLMEVKQGLRRSSKHPPRSSVIALLLVVDNSIFNSLLNSCSFCS